MSSNEFAFGVEYTPSTVSSPKAITVDDLEDLGISYVQVTWVDLTAMIRYRVVPISSFRKLLSSPRPGVALAKATMGLVYLAMAEGITAVGEYLYVLDLSTLRVVPYKPGYASVFGWFQEKGPIVGLDGQLTVNVNACPRALLRRVTEQARVDGGVEFLTGFETEFILLRSTEDPGKGVNNHHWSHSGGLLAGSLEDTVLREIVDSLIEGGIEVTMFHPEAAPGQYEVVTGPLLPLEAADAQIYTRETIINVAAKHGLRATFAPRAFMNSTGSGAHVHVSVHAAAGTGNGEKKVAGKLSSAESSFVSGLLEHIPAITAVSYPTPASYKRVTDGAWSGGTYLCWGTENREAPIRLANASSPASRNFELRFLDGTCNPYLALALILASGLRGIRAQAPLTVKDCHGPKSAAQMTDEERAELGITGRIPLSWDAAREAFINDEFITGVLGEELVAQYLSVNKLLKEMLNVGEDEKERLTRLVEFF